MKQKNYLFNKIMISIIIATLNEEEAIAKVLCSIPKKIAKKSEVIVVDVSTDYTALIAERLGAKVIKVKRKGKGRQMRIAVKKSKGDILVFLDGDGTDPPEYIPKLLKKLKKAHLVLGCRSMKRFKTDNKRMTDIFRVYSFFVRPLFHLINCYASDPLAGFRAIRKKDWDKLDLKSNAFEIETEMNIKAMKQGFKIKEIAIPHLKRGGGLRSSKLITDPKMWLRIMKVILKYLNDEKLKPKVKDFERKLKKKIK